MVITYKLSAVKSYIFKLYFTFNWQGLIWPLLAVPHSVVTSLGKLKMVLNQWTFRSWFWCNLAFSVNSCLLDFVWVYYSGISIDPFSDVQWLCCGAPPGSDSPVVCGNVIGFKLHFKPCHIPSPFLFSVFSCCLYQQNKAISHFLMACDESDLHVCAVRNVFPRM